MTMRSISGNIVNEGRVFNGRICVEGESIVSVNECDNANENESLFILPGVIDEHVHFREPGMTEKGDMSSESRAAAAGGVTSFFDMPNTKPQTTTIDALRDKLALAASQSIINYGCFIGATNTNIQELQTIDTTLVPGIKVFMGASTGNMLVDDTKTLDSIFALAAERGLPIVAHCEDSALIARNTERVLRDHGTDASVEFHPIIRNEEVCLSSTRRAIALAEKHGTQLLVAHVSTGKEIPLITLSRGNIKAETCVSYLTFCDKDYALLGSRIKCNPAIKTEADRLALRQALADSRIHCIATDHAPHLPADKQGGALKATSGMPSVQFSLVMMLQLADEGWLSVPQVAQLMCHAPAQLFGVEKRGFLRPGMKADITIVRHLDTPHTISDDEVQSKCGWTPYAGLQTHWQVEETICNGTTIYRHGQDTDNTPRAAQQIRFSHGH